MQRASDEIKAEYGIDVFEHAAFLEFYSQDSTNSNASPFEAQGALFQGWLEGGTGIPKPFWGSHPKKTHTQLGFGPLLVGFFRGL